MAMDKETLLSRVLRGIENAPKDGLVYLAADIDERSAFFACEGRILYAALAIEPSGHERIETQLMTLQTGVNIAPAGDQASYPSSTYDIIKLEAMPDIRVIEAFVTLCAAYSEAIDSQSFIDFFFALESLFKPDTVQSRRNAIGLFGELAFIESVWNGFGIDASDVWQLSGTTSRLDFVFDNANIEVKTTVREDDLVLVNHQQLFDDEKNHLFFVRLKTDPAGRSLQEISEALKSSGCMRTLHAQIILERELLQIEPKDLLRKYSVASSRLYWSQEINVFDEIDERVSMLKYMLNLAGMHDLSMERLFGKADI